MSADVTPVTTISKIAEVAIEAYLGARKIVTKVAKGKDKLLTVEEAKKWIISWNSYEVSHEDDTQKKKTTPKKKVVALIKYFSVDCKKIDGAFKKEQKWTVVDFLYKMQEFKTTDSEGFDSELVKRFPNGVEELNRIAIRPPEDGKNQPQFVNIDAVQAMRGLFIFKLLDEDKDGKLSETEFLEGFQRSSMFDSLQSATSVVKITPTSAFDYFDSNCDGFLDPVEALRMLEYFNKKMPRDKLISDFKVVSECLLARVVKKARSSKRTGGGEKETMKIDFDVVWKSLRTNLEWKKSIPDANAKKEASSIFQEHLEKDSDGHVLINFMRDPRIANYVNKKKATGLMKEGKTQATRLGDISVAKARQARADYAFKKFKSGAKKVYETYFKDAVVDDLTDQVEKHLFDQAEKKFGEDALQAGLEDAISTVFDAEQIEFFDAELATHFPGAELLADVTLESAAELLAEVLVEVALDVVLFPGAFFIIGFVCNVGFGGKVRRRLLKST